MPFDDRVARLIPELRAWQEHLHRKDVYKRQIPCCFILCLLVDSGVRRLFSAVSIPNAARSIPSYALYNTTRLREGVAPVFSIWYAMERIQSAKNMILPKQGEF